MSLISALIDIALEQQLQSIKIMPRGIMSGQSYLREACTVGFVLPRQSGKTTEIKRRATKKDLIVVHNYNTSRSFIDCNAKVIVSAEEHSLRGFVPEFIYVDEFKYCERVLEKLYKLYENATIPPVFVLIGT
jgi:hypothetical protein